MTPNLTLAKLTSHDKHSSLPMVNSKLNQNTIDLIIMSPFDNIVLIMLFVFFLKYVWIKKYIKIRIMLFKN